MHYKLNHTQKSRKGNNSFYCVVFGVVYKEITSCLKSYCSTSKNRTETARVSVLFFCPTFYLSSLHSLYIFGFLYCCIKAKTKLNGEVIMQESLGFWTPPCGFRSLLSVKLGFLIPVVSGITGLFELYSGFQSLRFRIPQLRKIFRNPDFTRKSFAHSGINKQIIARTGCKSYS